MIVKIAKQELLVCVEIRSGCHCLLGVLIVGAALYRDIHFILNRGINPLLQLAPLKRIAFVKFKSN